MSFATILERVGVERTSVTATVGGGTTGLIPEACPFVAVTSDDANKQISLPTASTGDSILISVGATGCELISSVAAHKANNVTVGATNELALAANTMYECIYVAANNWTVVAFSNVGAMLGPTTAALTTITIADAAGSPDYSILGLTQTTPFGFANLQDGVDLLFVVKNLQQQLAEIRAATKCIPDAL